MKKIPPDETPRAEDRLWTIGDVCHRLHVSRSLVYQLVHEGRLQTVRVGHALRFRAEDVAEYIRRQASASRKIAPKRKKPR